MQEWYPVVGRVLLGLLFALTGFFKLIGGMAGVAGYIASVGIPMAEVVAWVSTLVELLAGLALIAGFRSTIVAWTLVGFTLLATAFFHNQLSDQMQMTQVLKNLAIVGGLLYVVAYGAGKWSFDNKQSAPVMNVGM